LGIPTRQVNNHTKSKHVLNSYLYWLRDYIFFTKFPSTIFVLYFKCDWDYFNYWAPIKNKKYVPSCQQHFVYPSIVSHPSTNGILFSYWLPRADRTGPGRYSMSVRHVEIRIRLKLVMYILIRMPIKSLNVWYYVPTILRDSQLCIYWCSK